MGYYQSFRAQTDEVLFANATDYPELFDIQSEKTTGCL